MATRAQERFYDHDTNQWFDRGDEVPDEVVKRLSKNELLFEKTAETEQQDEAPRRGRAPKATNKE